MKAKIRSGIKKIFDQLKTPSLYPGAYQRHLDSGAPILDGRKANSFISNLILGENPCMIARFGSTELDAMLAIERFEKFSFVERFVESCQYKTLNLWNSPPVQELQTLSGFFPLNKKTLEKFLVVMKDAVEELDLLGSWLPLETRYTQRNPSLPACALEHLEPYFHDDPWSMCLAGKRVLVIHPFADLIKKQYADNRLNIFSDQRVLPEFSLSAIEAVQTLAGEKDRRFSDWFDALDWMEGEALTTDFDVAIIGCGAYGFPLASRLKKHGKKSIHLGGATQILFGIKGKRWDDRIEFSSMYNQYWVRPGGQGRPGNYQAVDGGCYW